MEDQEKPVKERRKRGKTPSDVSGDSGPLTIRISNKLRYGLELLARAQHRSLSQAVEWALQVGLNSYEVGDEPLGEILDKVWQIQSDGARMMELYSSAPALLAFEDFVTCEMIDLSRERVEFLQELPERELGLDKMELQDPRREELVERLLVRVRELQELYFRFTIVAWPLLKREAVQRANGGKATRGVEILKMLGLSTEVLTNAQVMESALLHVDKSLIGSDEALTKKLAELTTSVP